ncbi:MAG: helix-turn-helix transcriptional regulator [Chloroflexota bacterium]
MSDDQWAKPWTKGGRYLVWPVPAMVVFGARFRNGRLLVGASQQEVADSAGVSQTAVSRLERGLATGMTAERLIRIADAIGPAFPFGFCPHHRTCAWPSDPRQKKLRVALYDD